MIENPAKYDLFEAELRVKGLDEAYAINSSDINSYEARIAPYDSLVSFATTLFWVVMTIGCVVLIVIHTLNIRERKFEVGVLTVIGLQKWKVASQFLMFYHNHGKCVIIVTHSNKVSKSCDTVYTLK